MRRGGQIQLAKGDTSGGVTRCLLNDFISGRLSPGSRLVELQLAERFEVSRTPIRESIGELVALGVAQMKPNCGAVLLPFGPDEVRHLYQVRAVLEAEAARLACDHLTAGQVEQWINETLDFLNSTNRERGWSQAAWQLDCDLHEGIAAHCGNPRLVQEIQRYHNIVRVVRETIGNRNRVQEEALREHLDILRAFQAHEADSAAKAMRRHLTIAGQAAANVIPSPCHAEALSK